MPGIRPRPFGFLIFPEVSNPEFDTLLPGVRNENWRFS
jgi:hypothetical protein